MIYEVYKIKRELVARTSNKRKSIALVNTIKRDAKESGEDINTELIELNEFVGNTIGNKTQKENNGAG